MTDMQRAEMQYWRQVVYDYMVKQQDWRYPEDAVEALLVGTHNQEYLEDAALRYPVLRWRELSKIMQSYGGNV